MKVMCKLKRSGGTQVSIGAETYHFKPDDDGRHVAEVKNPKHLSRLLSIEEAYCLPGDEDIPAPAFDITDPRPPADGEGDDLTLDEKTDDDDGSDGVFSEPNESMYASMERDELASLVEQRTGQAPHHKTGKDKLIATLQALNATQ